MTKKVSVGSVILGGGESVKIQSMTTFAPSQTEKTINQIKELESAGCELIRFSILNETDALAIKEIKKHTKMPLIADIHFDYRLAIKSIECGADKIRINPGNIGRRENVERLAGYIKDYGVAVRVGSNSGSIEKKFLDKYGRNEHSLVESALLSVKILEDLGVENIVVSVKGSSVDLTVKSYRLISEKCNYPLHIGVTEAGTYEMGIVKSAIGIGSLLLDEIGDTLRVSLTGEPLEEIYAAKNILRAIGKDKNFVEVISCPTCGRCSWDSVSLANEINELTKNYNKPLKIAVMGCVVNGPGEAKECDIGIAGGGRECVIFKGGKIIKRVSFDSAKDELLKEIKKLIDL